jgi:hypothetical protein
MGPQSVTDANQPSFTFPIVPIDRLESELFAQNTVKRAIEQTHDSSMYCAWLFISFRAKSRIFGIYHKICCNRCSKRRTNTGTTVHDEGDACPCPSRFRLLLPSWAAVATDEPLTIVWSRSRKRASAVVASRRARFGDGSTIPT